MSTAILDLQAYVADQLAAARESVLAPTAKSIKAQNGKLLLPDGTTAPSADLIILSWRWMNRYYTAAWNPNVRSDPACWAMGSNPNNMAPGPCQTPQGADCQTCPKNQFGSATNGGRGKACRNQVVLACLPGDGVGELFTITLPPTSLQAFSKHVTKLASAKLIPAQAITRVSLDSSVSYAKYNFDATTVVDETELMGILERQQEANDFLESRAVAMALEAE